MNCPVHLRHPLVYDGRIYFLFPLLHLNILSFKPGIILKILFTYKLIYVLYLFAIFKLYLKKFPIIKGDEKALAQT